MIEADLKDIKERLARLENRTIEDSDAAAGDILELRRRLDIAEQKIAATENHVRQLQAA